MSLLLSAGGAGPAAGSPWYLWRAGVLVAAQLAASQAAWPDDWPPAYDRQLTPFRLTPVGGSQGQMSHRVVLTDQDGFPRQPDRTQALHAFRAITVTTTASSPWYLWQNGRAIFQDDPLQPASDYSLHRFRTVYQTVGQSYRLWPVASYRIEETYAQPTTELYGVHRYRVGYQTVGQPWSALAQAPGPRIDAEQVTPVAISYAPFFPTTVIAPPAPQPWNVYQWQAPVPDTAEPIQWRSRDFWSDLLPFLITPTNPVIVVPDLSGAGGGGGGYRWHNRPKWSKKGAHRDLADLLETVSIEVIYSRLVESPKAVKAAKVVRAEAVTNAVIPPPESVDWHAIENNAKKVARLIELWRQFEIEQDDEDFWFLS